MSKKTTEKENWVTISVEPEPDPNYKPPRRFEHTITHRLDLTMEALIIAAAIVIHGCLT